MGDIGTGDTLSVWCGGLSRESSLDLLRLRGLNGLRKTAALLAAGSVLRAAFDSLKQVEELCVGGPGVESDGGMFAIYISLWL